MKWNSMDIVPEISDNYLITMQSERSHYSRYTIVGFYHVKSKHWNYEWNCNGDIIPSTLILAWSKLPKPYNGDIEKL